VLFVVLRRCGGRLPPDPGPITCFVGNEPVPKTYGGDGAGPLRIGIAMKRDRLEKLDYSKFAYQLGHEMGHVMMGTRLTNGLVETLCDAFADQVLEDLADLWPSKYSDHRPWAEYGEAFREYRGLMEREDLARLPATVRNAVRRRQWSRVRAYLRGRQAELDASPYDKTGYALRRLGVALLRSGGVPWPELVGITAATEPPSPRDQGFRDDQPLVPERMPPAVRAALRRLGRE
jgi:hypothetical protein